MLKLLAVLSALGAAQAAPAPGYVSAPVAYAAPLNPLAYAHAAPYPHYVAYSPASYSHQSSSSIVKAPIAYAAVPAHTVPVGYAAPLNPLTYSHSHPGQSVSSHHVQVSSHEPVAYAYAPSHDYYHHNYY